MNEQTQKAALNANIFLTIALVIVLCFAAPIVVQTSAILGFLLWAFAAFYGIGTLIVILGQWLIESINQQS